jgi:hypothetical protein
VYAERASNYAGTRQPTTARGVVRPTAKEEGEKVIPGTDLSAQAKALVNGQPADPLLLAYGVHPQPGKPDHLACWVNTGAPCSDVFSFWTGSFASAMGARYVSS